ncbi:MAG: tyrosine-type recombinase/integrase [Proteobacteria bacterium]|nr:tyrosine-type recombinase/integrase [Pseudomonadota bacterium]
MSDCSFPWTKKPALEDALVATSGVFAEYLAKHGYCAAVTLKYSSAAAHFLYWIKDRRCRISDIDETLVDLFVSRHLSAWRCPPTIRRGGRASVRYALVPLLKMLREEGWIAPIAPPPRSRVEAELVEFERHLREVCGLAISTRRVYLQIVRSILSAHFSAKAFDFTQLTARDVRRVIQRRFSHWQPTSLRSVGVSLRSYFRFKAINGAAVDSCMAAIPQVARWRLESLPEVLTPAEVARLLAAFDRTSAKGLRDYAMARCLTDLDLRAIEVSRLQLQDVDWNQGTLAIRGKGRRVDLMPMPRELAIALAQYLRHGRPTSHSRALFLRRRAPRDLPPKTNAIYAALLETARRCGLQDRLSGTRLLRHTVATRLVQRGASLKIIADLLRHRCLNTTTIYAKVDLPALARVALPWPGRRP